LFAQSPTPKSRGKNHVTDYEYEYAPLLTD
jgi:hypothetical protein